MQSEAPSEPLVNELDNLPLCPSALETGISGLELILDWITEAEETDLLAFLGDVGSEGDSSSLESGSMISASWERVARRHVRHFGFVFDYATRSFSASLGTLPPLLDDAAARISALPQVNMPLDQVTANSYPPGAGLAAHIDTHFAFTGK